MNRRQIALKLVLKRLGIAQSLDSFAERLILQKAIYLAQQAGVPLGYHYSWYLRGPYSSDLTADAFAVAGAKIPKDWNLDASLNKKIEKIKSFLDEVQSLENNVREFEKLASILFVIKTGQAADAECKKITERMKAAGKDFTQEEVKHAVQTLRQKKFLAA